jgi:hypothetical protein
VNSRVVLTPDRHLLRIETNRAAGKTLFLLRAPPVSVVIFKLSIEESQHIEVISTQATP